MEISNKLNQELLNLVRIASKKDFKLNYMTVANMLQEHNFSLDNFAEIIRFFAKENIEIKFNDIDDEEFDENIISERMKPFDQTKIDISMKPMTLDLIITRLSNDEINLMPGFQRKSGLWNEKQKSRLIESLILRIPLPAFYFDGTNDEEWLIIDGLQRLTAIKEFFVDKSLKLEELEFLTDYEGCYLDDLPRTYIRRMIETQIIAYKINPGTPTSVKYNIFKRINTSGLELEAQEIRHALFQGNATRFLQKLAESENFLLATGGSVKSERMLDREWVLRFIAFRQLGVEKYNEPVDDFLNETMELLNKYNDQELAQLKEGFNTAMKLSYEVFGDKAFRKVFAKDLRRNPINVALFETWSVTFSLLNTQQVNIIKENKDRLFDRFILEMNENRTFAYQDLNSAKKHAIINRFDNVAKIVNEVLFI